MEWKPDDPREKTLDRTLAYHILIKKRWGDTTGKQWGRMSDILDEIAADPAKNVGFIGLEEEACEHFDKFMHDRGQSVKFGRGFWV